MIFLALDNEALERSLQGSGEKGAIMRGWCDLSEQEKVKIDREMCEKSQENMLFYYRNEIKNFLSGKPLPKCTARALFGNGILLRNNNRRFGAKYRVDDVVLKKYRHLLFGL